MTANEETLISETFRQKLQDNKVSEYEDKTGLNKFKIEFSENLYKAMNETIVDMTDQKSEVKRQQYEKPKQQFFPLYVQELKKLAWSYKIEKLDAKVPYSDVMTDIDSMALNLDRERKADGADGADEADGTESSSKYIDLHEFIVDPETNIAYSQKNCKNIWNQKWTITRTQGNDRTRCKMSQQKAFIIRDPQNKRYFTEKLTLYGVQWSRDKQTEIGGDDEVLPSPNQILQGIEKIHELQLEKMTTKDFVRMAATPCINPNQRIEFVKQQYKAVFERIRSILNFGNWDEPFNLKKGASADFEMSLLNPESKAVFLVLWLFSIEPPFYVYLNQACLTNDQDLQPLLGPWAHALSIVLSQTEALRQDKLPNGNLTMKMGTTDLGSLCQSFMCFHATYMKPMTLQILDIFKGITKYTFEQMAKDDKKKDMVASVQMPNFVSAYTNMSQALDLISEDKQGLQPVLMVLCVHNLRQFHGFRLNSDQFSTRPQEGEIVFNQALKVMLVGKDKIYTKQIQKSQKNNGIFQQSFMPKTVNVIYLFHN